MYTDCRTTLKHELPFMHGLKSCTHIKYRSDDITIFFFFFAFQRFRYHISVEHDEKHPQPKFGGNRSMWARDMAAIPIEISVNWPGSIKLPTIGNLH